MSSVFNEILATCSVNIRDEAMLPFNQIQKYLILADYDHLFNSILSYLHSNESSGSLLRFSTHVCLFLYGQNHSDDVHKKTFMEILTTYIHHLIELEFKDLVCYYISKLPSNNQCNNYQYDVFLKKFNSILFLATLMAAFLDTLSSQQDKEYYLKQGFTYKIDIDASLLILAANQQREQTFDTENNQEIITTNSKNLNEVFFFDHLIFRKNKRNLFIRFLFAFQNDHKQLEALKLLTTFLSTQTLDALRFANRICRCFLNDAKYEGIQTALSYFPHDIDIHTVRIYFILSFLINENQNFIL